MESILNVFMAMSSTVIKLVTCLVPVAVIQREQTLKQFKREIPVWMDEEYL